MTGSFLDVDAPNTAWRGSSEDPIPVIFGHYKQTAAIYRFFACRELDGHARTDATFWHPGTQARTVSKRVLPYRYWPRWKQGLFISRVPGLLGTWAGLGWLEEFLRLPQTLGYESPMWMSWEVPTAIYTPILGYGAVKGVRMIQDRRFTKNYVQPVYKASVAAIRTRDSVKVEIVPGLVHGQDPLATGRIYVPASLVSEGDRDNLMDAVRERLGHEALDGRWNMEGVRPHVELYTPPQPPGVVDWDTFVAMSDPLSPYLGQSALGHVRWDLGDDSPHIAVGGGSGSGKSELVAAIVSQFMRGGAGVVVLDPKYTSHRWLSAVPEVLYCREAQMIQDTVLWLDAELRRRGAMAARAADARQPEPTFERIVVVLEERNSLQTVITDHWRATRPRGAPMTPPARAALDRLASMGRSFNINVVLAAQEVTKADIGSRNNFGAFALAGRLPIGAWRLCGGPGTKKPPMKSTPGRFGYLVGGEVEVFQAAYPNLRHEEDRLIRWATEGDPMLDVRTLMQQHEGVPFPRPEAVASPDDDTEVHVTLSQFAESEECVYSLAALSSHRLRQGRAFPDSVGTGAHNAKLYRLDDLLEWQAQMQEEQD